MRPIKKCPHCGGRANIEYVQTKYATMCIVKCEVCNAQTRLFGISDSCSEDQAIAAWNGRVEDQDDIKQLLLDFISMLENGSGDFK